MGEPAPVESVCEVCGKAPVGRDDLLCPDCGRAFVLLLELIHGHPEVDVGDIDRIKEVFEWRMKKKGLQPSEPEVQEEQRVLSAAFSDLRKHASAARRSETAAAPAE
jgi:hypothetical protein